MSEKTKHQVTAADDDYSMVEVPESARKGFRSMFFVMLGITFFSASMSVGAKVGNGLDLNGFAAACVIGGVILSAYCGILAYIGSDTGMSMDLLCRSVRSLDVRRYIHDALCDKPRAGGNLQHGICFHHWPDQPIHLLIRRPVLSHEMVVPTGILVPEALAFVHGYRPQSVRAI